MTKKKVVTKTVSLNAPSMALESLITKSFTDEIAKQVRSLLAGEAQDPESYLMKTIEKRLAIADLEPAPAEAPRLFPAMELDEDEMKFSKALVSKTAKSMDADEKGLRSWAVIVDGKKLSPKALYRKAFEADGFKVDWYFTTYRALNFLAHHGFELTKI